MASRNDAGRSRHSSPYDEDTDSYELVYCHACSHEWEREGHGLTCPRCYGEVTEIISEANDPRDFRHHSSASTSPELTPLRYADSDPGEEDIDQHIGPQNFVLHRSFRPGPDHPNPHSPDLGAVMSDFVSMLQNLGGNRFAEGQNQTTHHHPTTHHRTTFQNRLRGGGGSASFTVITSSGRPLSGPSSNADGADPFQTIFSGVLGNMHTPRMDGPHATQGPPPPYANVLQQIFGMLDPTGPNYGDAVYSQEALDRIITNLMETNPTTNAAPPATQEALEHLDRRPVTSDLLAQDGKADCSICIDDMKEGDTAAFLPCKHSFHEECVTLWLREHNTCPICRTPIETHNSQNADGPSATRDGVSDQAPTGPTAPNFPSGISPGTRWSYQSSSTRPVADSPPGRTPWANAFSSNFSRPAFQADVSMPSQPVRPSMRGSRPPSQSQSRMNEAMRSISSRQHERAGPHIHTGTTTGYETPYSERRTLSQTYDTSGFQRRTSHSPTSPPVVGTAEHSASLRQRSPSHSRASGSSRDSRRQSHGPISWLRDKFSGGGGSGRGNPRDEQ